MKDNWTIRLIEVDNFTAVAMVNKGYLDFSNKSEFPLLLSVELSLVETIDDLPTENEKERLDEIEKKLVAIFKSTQEVLYIGHVTRKGFRDILCYISDEKLNLEAINKYCDTIEQERTIAIDINEDSEWGAAYGVLD